MERNDSNTYMTNYVRLCYVTQYENRKLLEELLYQKISPCEVYRKLLYGNNALCDSLKKVEQELIRECSEIRSFAKLDLHVIYLVLKNLNLVDPPYHGWYHTPRTTVNTIGDCVDLIQQVHNVIFHSGKTSFTDKEVRELFSLFKDIAKVFERSLNKNKAELVVRYINLESCCVDNKTNFKYIKELRSLETKWENRNLDNQYILEVLQKEEVLFTSRINPMEILPHLTSISEFNKQEIIGKQTKKGDRIATLHLLNQIRQEERYLIEFIRALRHPDICKTDLADKLDPKNLVLPATLIFDKQKALKVLQKEEVLFTSTINPMEILPHLTSMSELNKQEIICEQNNNGKRKATSHLLNKIREQERCLIELIRALRQPGICKTDLADMLDPENLVLREPIFHPNINKTDSFQLSPKVTNSMRVIYAIQVVLAEDFRMCIASIPSSEEFRLKTLENWQLDHSLPKHLKDSVYFRRQQGYECFSLSLIQKLIKQRFICDHNLANYSRKIMNTRKTIIFRGNAYLSDTEMEETFLNLKQIAHNLENMLKLPTGKLMSKLEYCKTCCMDDHLSKWYHERLKDLAEREHKFETTRHLQNLDRMNRFWYLPHSPAKTILEVTPYDPASQYVLIGYAFEETLAKVLQKLLSYIVPHCLLLFTKLFGTYNDRYFNPEKYLLIFESQKNGYLDFDTMLLSSVMLSLKETKKRYVWETIQEMKQELLKNKKKELTEIEMKQCLRYFKDVAKEVEQILLSPKGTFVSLFEKLENLLTEEEQLKVLFASLVEKAQKQRKPIWMEKESVVQKPSSSLLDSKEFYDLLVDAFYISYENRVCLGGLCNAGKTSLACIFTGDEVPCTWNSTNGLQIYFGRNGIHLKDKKMIPLGKGMLCHKVQGKVISALNEMQKEFNATKTLVEMNDKKENDDFKLDDFFHNLTEMDKTEKQDLKQIASNTDSQSAIKDKLDISKRNLMQTPKLYYNAIEESKLSGAKEVETSKTSNENSDTHINKKVEENTNSKFSKAQSYIPEPSTKTLNVIQEETLYKSILDEVRRGEYNLEIAPSDLVDFGGKKAFDMTHQLFILQEGTVLLLFDGSKDLDEPLPEYHGKNISSADILLHWVNSVSTFCTRDSGMQMIQFVATHSDKYKDNFEIRRKELVTQLTATFHEHEKRSYLSFDNMFFIDARNKDDNEIDKLKDKLVQIAFSQKSWGKKMPLLWVPLEKQIIDLKLRGNSIVRITEIQKLNKSNEDLMMDEEKLNFFLRTQHAIGKIVFFDEGELAEFVIIEPSVLVNALRSFVTDEIFFPTKDIECYDILKHLQMNGMLKKNDLMKLWNQDEFVGIFQNQDYKEYILRILLHLDVLVEPNLFDQNVNFSPEYYIVPCMVQTRLDNDFTEKYLNRDRSICMAYVLKVQIVPPCVFFRLIASAIGIWPLKEYKGRKMIFNDIATFVFDDNNDFSIITQGRRIVVFFTNSYSIRNILPPKVASVQESLTKAMKSITEFYQLHSRSIDSLDRTTSGQIFEIEFGAACITPCFFKRGDELSQLNAGIWKCKHGQFHEADYLSYWDSMKNHGKTQKTFTILDISPTVLMTKPTTDLLRKVSFAVGTDGAGLGLNLGIENSVIENTVISNRYNIFEKTQKLLDFWEMSGDSVTVKDLVRALKNIGGRGLETVVEYYSNKPMKRGRSKSVTMLLSTQDGYTEEKGTNVLYRQDFVCDGFFVDCIVDKRIDMREKEEKDDCIKRLIEFDGLYNRHLLLQERIDKKYYHFNKITDELTDAILHKDLLLFRHILAYWNLFNNDIEFLKQILELSIKNQCACCAGAIAWKITRIFLKEVSVSECYDIWPGFRCACKNGYVLHGQHSFKFCSPDVVIIVEVGEKEYKCIQANSFHDIPIRYEKQISYSQEGKRITEKIASLQEEDPEWGFRGTGVDSFAAKHFFAQHRKLSVISPSPIKSRGYPLKQDFIKGPCIQLFCRLKGYIPVGEAHYPSEIDGIPTDILQGYAELLVEDIRIGSEVGRLDGKTGTLGGFVRYLGKDAFLTCAHVIIEKNNLVTRENRKQIHENPITVYYKNQGPDPSDARECGELIAFAFPPDNSDGVHVDAAIIQLDKNLVKINTDIVLLDDNRTPIPIKNIGMSSPYLNECCLDYTDVGTDFVLTTRSCGITSGLQKCTDKVEKVGDKSLKFNTLTESVRQMLIQNPRPPDVSEEVHFVEQIKNVEDAEDKSPSKVLFCNQISLRNVDFKPGDSGTCIYVVGPAGKCGCIGMAIASHPGGGCIVTPIKAIMSALRLL